MANQPDLQSVQNDTKLSRNPPSAILHSHCQELKIWQPTPRKWLHSPDMPKALSSTTVRESLLTQLAPNHSFIPCSSLSMHAQQACSHQHSALLSQSPSVATPALPLPCGKEKRHKWCKHCSQAAACGEREWGTCTKGQCSACRSKTAAMRFLGLLAGAATSQLQGSNDHSSRARDRRLRPNCQQNLGSAGRIGTTDTSWTQAAMQLCGMLDQPTVLCPSTHCCQQHCHCRPPPKTQACISPS